MRMYMDSREMASRKGRYSDTGQQQTTSHKAFTATTKHIKQRVDPIPRKRRLVISVIYLFLQQRPRTNGSRWTLLLAKLSSAHEYPSPTPTKSQPSQYADTQGRDAETHSRQGGSSAPLDAMPPPFIMCPCTYEYRTP